MTKPPKPPAARPVEAFTHAAGRRNIPTAELQSLAEWAEEAAPVPVAHYPRARPLAPGTQRPRDADRDPQLIWNGMRIRITEAQRRELVETGTLTLGEAQLVWRGKDTQDWSDLVVRPPPIYVQEKVHPKAIIADLQRQSATRRAAAADTGSDLFADFNGLPDPEARLEFYQHDQHWSNRMILGDSLQVMASLAEREGLRGKVQCIYFDPPYGIKFNSNWQVSTLSTSVEDDKKDLSREPEQVKAFRDTWQDGVHSYLTYLRDRLTVGRALLQESGIVFVQIGDENVHRVRAMMDEVFGPENALSMICFKKTHYQEADLIANISDYLLVYCRNVNRAKPKFRKLWRKADLNDVDYVKYTKAKVDGRTERIPKEWREDPSLIPESWIPFRDDITLTQDGEAREGQKEWTVFGKPFFPGSGRHWRTHERGRERLIVANRVKPAQSRPFYIEGFNDSPSPEINNLWTGDLAGAQNKAYVVQTNERVVERCILMATDPGDLVLDPTCGSGTTAAVAEQWGRRWITIDTSRVALALARTRIMAAKYPYYLLADSTAGRAKEAALTGKPAPDSPVHHDLRQGFVYDRAPHVTLKSIANNAEIDVLWEQAQTTLEPLRLALNEAFGRRTPTPSLRAEGEAIQGQPAPNPGGGPASPRSQATARDDGEAWEEWQIPREAGADWSAEALRLHAEWWQARIARQRAIDASIARKAEVELLYDRPYEDNKRVRVAGPFTVESLSPHRVLPQDDMELIDELDAAGGARAQITPPNAAPPTDFAAMVLDHLRTAGVQQHEKSGRIAFDSLTPWPGTMIAAVGTYREGKSEAETTRRAAILIGPEFGTLTRPDITAAAREASDARFDLLIACAFNYDAHAADLTKLGPLPILQARINPDLHMSDELKNTGRGNLFVVFGAPDIQLHDKGDGMIAVQVLGVDVFDPRTGDVRSGGTESIAAWFIDTMYNEESFFVRHAYFLGANDPYKSLKTALRAEIDEDAWASLYRDTSRPFPRPETGRIAVKVINHFGDEVMKVFSA